MKKITQTTFINLHDEQQTFLENVRYFIKMAFLLIAFLCAFNVSGQQTSRELPVMHVNQFLASQPASDLGIIRTKSLLKDLQPSVYITSNQASVYGERPVCLFTDIVSIASIDPTNQALHSDTIEMVTITIEKATELSTTIDLSVFANFPKLKYIYIQSNVATTSTELIRMIRNNNSRFHVFYNILKNS